MSTRRRGSRTMGRAFEQRQLLAKLPARLLSCIAAAVAASAAALAGRGNLVARAVRVDSELDQHGRSPSARVHLHGCPNAPQKRSGPGADASRAARTCFLGRKALARASPGWATSMQIRSLGGPLSDRRRHCPAVVASRADERTDEQGHEAPGLRLGWALSNLNSSGSRNQTCANDKHHLIKEQVLFITMDEPMCV